MKRAFACLGALATPTLAQAGVIGTAGAPAIDLVRIALSLLLCLGFALAAIALLRRKAGLAWLPGTARGAHHSIQVKETRRISLSAELCRFECDGREFLLVVTPQSATLLRERVLEDQIAQP